MKIPDVFFFSFLLIMYIFVHSRNQTSFSRQAKQDRLQFSGSGLDAWGDRAMALAAADKAAGYGEGAEAARKGRPFCGGAGWRVGAAFSVQMPVAEEKRRYLQTLTGIR